MENPKMLTLYSQLLETSMPDSCKLLMGKLTESICEKKLQLGLTGNNYCVVEINRQELADFFKWHIKKIHIGLKRLEKENIVQIIDNRKIKVFNYHIYMDIFQLKNQDGIEGLKKFFNDLNDDTSMYLYLGEDNIQIPYSVASSKLDDACKVLLAELSAYQLLKNDDPEDTYVVNIHQKHTIGFLNWTFKKLNKKLVLLEKEGFIKRVDDNYYEILEPVDLELV